VFGIWGGAAFEETAKMLASMGFVPGTLWAGVAGVLEVLFATALVLGALTRWVAMVLALETVGALVLVHLPAWISSDGARAIALDTALLGGLLSLICSGTERYALDARIPAFRNLSLS
jgi:putative oxidoreductase